MRIAQLIPNIMPKGCLIRWRERERDRQTDRDKGRERERERERERDYDNQINSLFHI